MGASPPRGSDDGTSLAFTCAAKGMRPSLNLILKQEVIKLNDVSSKNAFLRGHFAAFVNKTWHKDEQINKEQEESCGGLTRNHPEENITTWVG